jgi:hypothetical protein
VGGNSLASTGTIGTTSNNNFDMVTNNTFRGRISNAGQMLYGSTAPSFTTGLITVTSNNTFIHGVLGLVGSTTGGAAVSGLCPPSINSGWAAVDAETGGSGTGAAVYGLNLSSNSGTTTAGAYGEWDGTAAMGGIGVVGNNTNSTSIARMGVLGLYDPNAYGMGVIGLAYGGSIPTATMDAAVVGMQANNANYSGYFNGNHVISNGTKSGSVPTSRGNQLLYCAESPEVWFEDLGGGVLQNGQATIQLDPLFLETVVIDDAHPMRVFIQMEGESQEVFVTKTHNSFTVKERNSGNSNAAFSYRVMAKRVNFQDHRFGNDPVWGPGDTRQYSSYAKPTPIDYNECLQFWIDFKKNYRQGPLPETFKAYIDSKQKSTLRGNK